MRGRASGMSAWEGLAGERRDGTERDAHLDERVSQPLAQLVEADKVAKLFDAVLLLEALNWPNVAEADAVNLAPRCRPHAAQARNDNVPERVHLHGDFGPEHRRRDGLRGRVPEEVVDEVARARRAVLRKVCGVGRVGENAAEADEKLRASVDARHRVRVGDLQRLGDLLWRDLRQPHRCVERARVSLAAIA